MFSNTCAHFALLVHRFACWFRFWGLCSFSFSLFFLLVFRVALVFVSLACRWLAVGLPLASRCFPLLPVASRCFPLLPVGSRCFPLFACFSCPFFRFFLDVGSPLGSFFDFFAILGRLGDLFRFFLDFGSPLGSFLIFFAILGRLGDRFSDFFAILGRLWDLFFDFFEILGRLGDLLRSKNPPNPQYPPKSQFYSKIVGFLYHFLKLTPTKK